MLSLQLLGGLQIRFEGQPLPARAGQRKRAALLVLLATSPKRAVARERLIGLLWPEYDNTRARHQLAAASHDLRSVIGDLLISEGDSLALADRDISCDLWSFRRALSSHDPAEAARLYRGPLLDGFYLPGLSDFERWLSAERDRLDQEYAAALEAAAIAASAVGALDEAVEWWSRRAAHDSYDSRVAIRLMRALVASGNPAGAVRHARAHAALVRSELEVEPDPSVERFAAELQAGLHCTEVEPPLAHTDHPIAKSASVHNRWDHADTSSSEISTDLPSDGGRTRPHSRQRFRLLAPALGIALASTSAGLLFRTQHSGATTAQPPPSASSRADLTHSTMARALYMHGRAHWARRTHAALDTAVVELRRATEEDPLFAAAYSGLAEVYAMLGYFGFSPGEAVFPKAKAAAYQALELDPNDGDAYAALGQALAWEHRWSEADSVYQRGTRLAPDNPTVHQWYALLDAYLGRSHAAAVETGIAARLDPLSIQINNMYATMRFEDGDTVGALRHFERTVDDEPDSAWVRQNPWVLENYAQVVGAAGKHAEAIRLLELALRVVPTHPRPLLSLAEEYVRVGDTASAIVAFARADTTHPHYAVYRGMFAAMLGRMDEAFRWLDGVRDWSLSALVKLNNGAQGERLRADPRYARLRARLGMPPR